MCLCLLFVPSIRLRKISHKITPPTALPGTPSTPTIEHCRSGCADRPRFPGARRLPGAYVQPRQTRTHPTHTEIGAGTARRPEEAGELLSPRKATLTKLGPSAPPAPKRQQANIPSNPTNPKKTTTPGMPRACADCTSQRAPRRGHFHEVNTPAGVRAPPVRMRAAL